MYNTRRSQFSATEEKKSIRLLLLQLKRKPPHPDLLVWFYFTTSIGNTYNSNYQQFFEGIVATLSSKMLWNLAASSGLPTLSVNFEKDPD